MLIRRPTVAGVAAYFDLVTDDTRLFFGDSFHVGYPDASGLVLSRCRAFRKGGNLPQRGLIPRSGNKGSAMGL
jgi:hypothetical protein